MDNIIEQAIERLRQMPEERQDLIARLILHEIEEDERWMCSTDANAAKLQRLVDLVYDADDRGECEPLDPDQL
ncbi:MAG: hypothetical protein L0228_21570 [Planctomycetes bacterium]|nr:hypothetical protein [Planctomycetota bacterium]